MSAAAFTGAKSSMTGQPSSPPVVSLHDLPLSFASGLSISIDRRRQFTQDIVPLLPAHHLGHLPVRAVGIGAVGFRSTIAKRRQALYRSAPAALVSDRGATKARCTLRILPTVGRRTERRRHGSVREAIYPLDRRPGIVRRGGDPRSLRVAGTNHSRCGPDLVWAGRSDPTETSCRAKTSSK